MDRDRILAQLRAHFDQIRSQYGVRRLAVFGSTARGTARADSDIDILVRFEGAATASRFFGLQFFLEDLLGAPVDLVSDKALRAELRPHIERELIDVAA